MKSQDMPAWLVDIVLHTCRVAGKEDSPLRFSYRVVSVETGIYHIIACAAGSGIHNLILTPAEVTNLRRNANRPTPAGIMLALQRAGFWKPENITPSLHCEEPRLAASALPEADFQATWKSYTGHKNNARIFLTAPYNKESLVLVPNDWDALGILQLLHESDWLSSLRGWGRTFTTQAQLGDSFEETDRIFLFQKDYDSSFFSGLVQRAPILNLTRDFNLQEITEKEPPPVQTKQTTPTQVAPKVEKNVTDYHVPYIYLESPDEEIYDINPRSHPLLRWSLYIGALALLGMGVHFMVSETADHAGEVTRKAIEAITPEDDLLQLRELSKTPYSPDSITRKLDKIYAHLTAAPVAATGSRNNEDILEIVAILKYAATDTTGHALNIQRLREYAQKLQIDANALSRLYLNEATHDCSVQDWEKHLTPAEIGNWQQLLQHTPELREILLSHPFAPYAKNIMQESQESEQVQAPQQNQDDTPGTNPQLAESLTCIEGESVPENFLQAILQAPTKLQHGQWCIMRRYNDSGSRSRHMGELSPQGNHMLIESCGKNKYQITSSAKDSDVPALQFKIIDGKLEQLQCEEAPAAAILPILNSDNTYSPLILLPHRDIQLHPMGESAPPDVQLLDLNLQAEDIVQLPNADNEYAQLDIAQGKGFPWTPMMSELTLNHGQIVLNLPILTGPNKLTDSGNNTTTKYCWSYQKLPAGNTTYDLFECHLLRVYDFSQELRRAFHLQANTYCMGSKNDIPSFYSLATLYSVTQEPTRAHEATAAVEKCRKLLLNPDFKLLTVNILSEHKELAASVQTASIDDACVLLTSTAHRDMVRQAILSTLSNYLKQLYSSLRQKEINNSSDVHNIVLSLNRVQVSPQGELIWEFALQQVADQ